jgi:hypothetical protein
MQISIGFCVYKIRNLLSFFNRKGRKGLRKERYVFLLAKSQSFFTLLLSFLSAVTKVYEYSAMVLLAKGAKFFRNIVILSEVEGHKRHRQRLVQT